MKPKEILFLKNNSKYLNLKNKKNKVDNSFEAILKEKESKYK